MSEGSRHYLGLDLGPSSVKAVILSDEGQVVAEATSSQALLRGKESLADFAQGAFEKSVRPVSGRQEYLEGQLTQALEGGAL